MSTPEEEKGTDMINDIEHLQTIEMDLFSNLEKGMANNSLSSEEKNKIVEQINKVSDIRVKLFETLHNLNQHYQQTVSASGNVINQQLNAVVIVENELNTSKARLKAIEEDKNNKMRLVEINTYYGEKYSDQTDLMKWVVYFCIPIIILAYLASKQILPNFIYKGLLILILVAAVIVLGWKLVLVYSHDNMNYQEYKFNSPTTSTNTTTMPPIDKNDSSGTNPWYSEGATCVAQECCADGFTYVPSPTNKCVINSNLPEGVTPYNANQQDNVSTTNATTTPVQPPSG